MSVRVLLLDDDLAFATEARSAFSAAGCQVEVLRDGEAALARAAESPPDIVIVSAELSGINGFRLCSRLKKDHEGLPVVVTFADSSSSGVASHQRLPSKADAYVPRSVAIHELVTRVRGLTPGGTTPAPGSVRRRSMSPVPGRGRAKTPRSNRPAAASRPPLAVAVPPAPATPAVPRPMPAGAAAAPPPARSPSSPGARPGLPPRPEIGSSPDLTLRRAVAALEVERDELRRTLEATRTDAEALRRTTDAARHEAEALRQAAEALRREVESLRSERDMHQREATLAARDVESLTAELETLRGDRDEKLRELEVSRARIARLEQQVVEVEREMYGATSERVDQRLMVLQKAAESSRVERDELRRELEAERTRRQALAVELAEAIAAKRAEEEELQLDESDLVDDDGKTPEARAAALAAAQVDQARREHALEMTRLRGEHAAVVFQLRHELASLRGTAMRPSTGSLPNITMGGGTLPPGTATPAGGTPSIRPEEALAAAAARASDEKKEAQRRLAEALKEHEEAVATMRDKHARETAAMRANIDVAIRRIESLERQLGDSAGSGERPSVVTARPVTRKRDEAGR